MTRIGSRRHRNPTLISQSSAPIPTTLAGQAKRHLPAYVVGMLMLASFQFAMNRIDWLSKAAIDRIFGVAGGAAWVPVTTMLVLAVFAFVTRVASRWFVFNAGRDVEYELRGAMLARHRDLPRLCGVSGNVTHTGSSGGACGLSGARFQIRCTHPRYGAKA